MDSNYTCNEILFLFLSPPLVEKVEPFHIEPCGLYPNRQHSGFGFKTVLRFLFFIILAILQHVC